MINQFFVISGYLTILSGVALLVYWYSYAVFLPYRNIAESISILVTNRNWKWINTMGVVGAAAGLMGQAGILLIQMENPNRFGLVGFFVAVAGALMLIGTMLWDTILWPILIKQDPSILDFRGPIYSSSTFLPFFITAGIIYTVGNVLVGVGIIKSAVLAATAGFLISVGAPLFGLGSLLGKLQVYPRTIGMSLMSGGFIWIGLEMVASI